MKTFYSIYFNGIGFVAPKTAWFDSRDDAISFWISCECADDIRCHNVRIPARIAELEEKTAYWKQCLLKGEIL